MAWYLKITCYKVTIKISQFSAWFSLRHKLQPALIAPVSIYVVLSISTMVFTTIYEFLESLIENTHTCYTLWLWKMQFSLGKDRPGGVATAPRLKSGQGSLTRGTHSLRLPQRAHTLPGQFLPLPLSTGWLQSESVFLCLSLSSCWLVIIGGAYRVQGVYTKGNLNLKT